MRRRILLLFLALWPLLSSPLQAGVWENITGYFKGPTRPEPPSIRILVLHDVEGANLQIRGRYSLYDPYTNSHVSSRFAGKSRYIQALGDGLKWGESFPGLYQLRIEPDDNDTLVTINGHDYEGLVYVYDIGGTISIVNQIPIEDYVQSVLNHYRDQNLEPETLSALAIVTRTNAYFQAFNPKNTYWAIDAQKVGFQGRIPGNSSLANAANQTRYMIMSRTGVYEGVATPFAAQFGNLPTGQSPKDIEVSKITLEEANTMAKKGEHAAQILAKAFPGSTIMLMRYSR
jgi:stage II sporulation protein D